MKNQRRSFALLFALAFCFFVLLSSTYVAAEANHVCRGEDCPVCCQISLCETMLKTVSAGVAAVGVGIALVLSLLFFLPSFVENRRPKSLITLKVKLSN